MKKTIFDKIVVGFVLLVIAIFSVLALYTVHMTQSRLLDNTEKNLNTESKLIIETTIHDYLNNTIDQDTFFDRLDDHADTMNAEIWFSTPDNKIIYCSNKDSVAAKDLIITDFYERTELFTKTIKTGTLNGCFNTKTLSISTPVYQDNTYAGLLSIHLSLQFIKDIAQKTFASTYMPFLVIVVLSLIALMLISNSTLKPIREIIATSKQYAAGNFNARIDVHTDNEFGELARYMEEMADELSRSNEYRRSFISNISHDFRSPLTSIKGYIEAMIDGTIPPDKHEKYLQIVLSETMRLTKLTQGLLELNNFDSFDLQLDKSNFDIKSIILPTINTFEGRCQDKGIYLHAIFHTDNTIVYADRTRIQQVIYNLVDNAIKFTPEGRQITVQVTEKSDKIFVSVKDEGVGIPPESIKKVFDRFYKTDPSRGKDKTGTGLGLAITKEIIKAHGENITLNSKVGEGSEFIFSLPMQKEMQVPIKAVHVKKEEADTQYISNGKFRIKKN